MQVGKVRTTEDLLAHGLEASSERGRFQYPSQNVGTDRPTVAQLAEEVDLDLDEAIVTLWDAGFDELTDPSDVIPAGRVRIARRALGIATPRELMSPEYWRRLLNVEPVDFVRLLDDIGVSMAPGSRRLPKGAIRKLKRVARERLGDVDVLPPPVIEPAAVSLPPLQWEPVGHQQTLRHLSADEIAGIHECLEEDFAETDDPIWPPGLRDRNLLESASFRPLTSLGETCKYPTVEMAAAALLHSLTLNHAFHNGNKRTALVAMLVLLDENEMQLTCQEVELFRLVLLVAQHRLVPRGADDRADREVMEITRWIKRICDAWSTVNEYFNGFVSGESWPRSVVGRSTRVGWETGLTSTGRSWCRDELGGLVDRSSLVRSPTAVTVRMLRATRLAGLGRVSG